ncbi:MAG: thioredoxin domain-containing protein [Anaerolineae bacterium]|nr:thioredoxin domain-containing protein [Anaerolineae bacterium]
MEKSIPRQTKLAPPNQNRNRMIIGGVIGLAVIAAIIFIVISLNGTNNVAVGQYTDLPQSRLPDGGFVVGNVDAPVTIIEFADYACPHCQEYLPTMNQFMDTYVKTGKAKFEYRILPTAGGEMTQFIGNVLVCMEQQKAGSFWKAHDILYQDAMAGNYTSDTIRGIASDLGVNYADALNCSKDQKQVATDMALADQLNVHGTPAIRVRDASGKAGSLVVDGQSYDSGGPSYGVLSQYMAQYQ